MTIVIPGAVRTWDSRDVTLVSEQIHAPRTPARRGCRFSNPCPLKVLLGLGNIYDQPRRKVTPHGVGLQTTLLGPEIRLEMMPGMQGYDV